MSKMPALATCGVSCRRAVMTIVGAADSEKRASEQYQTPPHFTDLISDSVIHIRNDGCNAIAVTIFSDGQHLTFIDEAGSEVDHGWAWRFR